MERPCAKACGMDAIKSDDQGKADIDHDKCVSCGMCLVNCPFGAIVDKGQIFQLIHAMKTGKRVIAIVAPAFVGQFGPKASPEKLTAAMKKLGFDSVVEVAIGADLCAIEEAKDFMREVPEKQPFMATSCCPAWSVMAKKLFPDISQNISMAMTPMVLTARMVKEKNPDAFIAFIGPCAAKKLEASRRSIRSDVDFVLTFEELMGMFEAKDVKFEDITDDEAVELNEGTGDGRIFAVSGGVAKAVADVIGELDPEREIKVESAQGLRDCRKLLMLARAGKYNGYLLEGMACPGGCVAGAGTLQAVEKSTALVNKYAKEADKKNALETDHEITLGFKRE
jgi:[FeFe] hydrogenase (group B1/B3)